MDNSVILKGLRIVGPQILHSKYVQQLHKGHLGADATKKRARDIVYWPCMMLDIESAIASCKPCKSHWPKHPLP